MGNIPQDVASEFSQLFQIVKGSGIVSSGVPSIHDIMAVAKSPQVKNKLHDIVNAAKGAGMSKQEIYDIPHQIDGENITTEEADGLQAILKGHDQLQQHGEDADIEDLSEEHIQHILGNANSNSGTRAQGTL